MLTNTHQQNITSLAKVINLKLPIHEASCTTIDVDVVSGLVVSLSSGVFGVYPRNIMDGNANQGASFNRGVRTASGLR